MGGRDGGWLKCSIGDLFFRLAVSQAEESILINWEGKITYELTPIT